MKYSGVIGFGIPKERDGINEGAWEDEITDERVYYGDVLNAVQRWSEDPATVHNDLKISDSISILADAFAVNHVSAIRYIYYAGAYWSISSVEIKRPRLILHLGGVYHGPTAGVSSGAEGPV